MTRIVGDNKRLNNPNKWLAFHLVGTMLLITGFLALVLPDILLNIFAKTVVDFISFLAVPFIIIGILLEGYGIFLKIKQHKVKQHNTQDLDENHDLKSVISDDKTNNMSELENTVDWSPVKGGGASFKTHQLKEFNDGRICFLAAPQLIIFAGAFSTIGAVIGGVFLFSSGEIFPALFGLLFVGIGYAIYHFLSTPRIFDITNGYYWRGARQLHNKDQLAQQKDVVKLDEIQALQIVSEYIRGNKSSYHSYELNIVKKDNTRICVVDHGSRNTVEQDAKIISKKLNIPLLAKPL